MDLLPFVLAAMNLLAPARDNHELAEAVAAAVREGDPLFKDDADRTRTAALVVAVAYRESGFDNGAKGDRGHSVCAMQILGGDASLLEDPRACVGRGLAMLRESARVDRAHPVAFYARGGRYWRCLVGGEPDAQACREGVRISNDRVALARRTREKVLGSAP